uniref:Uncharacterized protein n=1 Tax=Brugia timori TaxID=42155 RepID=A0A0R3QI60_9BILA
LTNWFFACRCIQYNMLFIDFTNSLKNRNYLNINRNIPLPTVINSYIKKFDTYQTRQSNS